MIRQPFAQWHEQEHGAAERAAIKRLQYRAGIMNNRRVVDLCELALAGDLAARAELRPLTGRN